MSTQAFKNLTTRLEQRLKNRENNNYSVRILLLIQKLERLAGGLEKLRDNKNPTETPEAHSRKVANLARKLQDENARINAQINEIIVTGSRELYKLIDEQAALVESDYSAEIRATFRAMDEKQRTDVLLNALKEGNSQIVAAVGLAPAILSGIGEDEKDRYMQGIREQKCPELLQELDDINESLRTADAAKQLCDRMFDANYCRAEQAKIDQAEQIARDAEAELQQAIAS